MCRLPVAIRLVNQVGDCYVAVTGLPGALSLLHFGEGFLPNQLTCPPVPRPLHHAEPQEDHALIMVRFARDCMYKSYELTKKLEVTLGPDTAGRLLSVADPPMAR
jgi:hypothetical protein